MNKNLLTAGQALFRNYVLIAILALVVVTI